MMAWCFWIAVAVIVYAYAGYFLIACAAARIRPRSVACGDCEPLVTVIIAAYNEAASIGATLARQLASDYPSAKRQIIVVSDASVDGTDDIVRTFPSSEVLLLRQERRRGKTAALDLAVAHATGAVLVFADANSLYAPDAIRRLVRNFSDPSVGYVTGRMIYRGGMSVASLGSRAYMAYEDRLRRAETALGSIVGVNGGIDAVRRELYQPMRDDQLPDFVLPLRVADAGYRVVYERSAIVAEEPLVTARHEYRMRVRVALRAWWALWDVRGVFDVRRHGLFAFQVFSHKLLRYLAWAALPVAYAASIALAPSGIVYLACAVLGSLLLLTAAVGAMCERGGRHVRLAALPYYFLLVNAAAAHAFVNFLRGRRTVIWTPRLG